MQLAKVLVVRSALAVGFRVRSNILEILGKRSLFNWVGGCWFYSRGCGPRFLALRRVVGADCDDSHVHSLGNTKLVWCM